jgi:hypothetical protein
MSLLWYYYVSLPKRIKRLYLFLFKKETYKRRFWFLEWPLLVLDVFGVPELLQAIHRLVLWDQRKLSLKEKTLAYDVFEESIYWENIRMNPHSWISRRFKFAFVSFHTIHYADKISDDILIHELVHVWQYEKFGSAYIVRALHAQNTAEGYDYGGIIKLQEKDKLTDFNFEQMAEVIRDAYLQGCDHPVFNKYIQQLFE